MIKYKLICQDCEITFDSWFSTSREYEKLKKKKFLNCHMCNSLNVEKTLMSPSIFKSKENIKVDVTRKKYKEIKKTISKYQEFIKKILIMWEKILLMRQDLYTIKIKNRLREFMAQQPKKTLKS